MLLYKQLVVCFAAEQQPAFLDKNRWWDMLFVFFRKQVTRVVQLRVLSYARKTDQKMNKEETI